MENIFTERHENRDEMNLGHTDLLPTTDAETNGHENIHKKLRIR